VTAKGDLWRSFPLSLVGIVHFRIENPAGLSLGSLGIADTLAVSILFFKGSSKVPRLASLIQFSARTTGAHPREQVPECVLAHLQHACTGCAHMGRTRSVQCPQPVLNFHCTRDVDMLPLLLCQGRQERVNRGKGLGVVWSTLPSAESTGWHVLFALVLVLEILA